MSKKILLLTIPIIVILIGCLTALCFITDDTVNEVYVRHINTAEKRLSEGDYQGAITYYQKAIDADKTQESPYICIADIYYYNMNDLRSAIKTLELGIQNANTENLRSKLKLFEQYLEQQSPTDAADNKLKSDTPKGTMDIALVDTFAAFSFEKYSEKYTVSQEQYLNGVYTVRYLNLGVLFSYDETGGDKLIVSSTGKPYKWAMPSKIEVDDISTLIYGLSEGVGESEIKSIGADDIKTAFDKTLNKNLMTFKYKNCKFTVECDENGNILESNCYNTIVPEASANKSEKIKVSGKIVNVENASPISGATLVFRSGKNNRSGDAVLTIESPDGSYNADLEPGDYTVEVSANGYNKEYFDLYVSNTGSPIEKDFSVSRSLGSGQIRIVLEWGESPSDLDSHLVGTTGDGTTVDVSFTNKTVSNSSGVIAQLDVDDQSGFGPETITLSDTSGEFTYRVHRYFGFGSLATSGATVKVYTSDNSQPTIISVPDSVSGDWWDVFRIVNGQIVDINGAVS